MFKTALLILAAVFLFNCGEVPSGEPVDISKACPVANDGKYVQVHGFLSDGGSIFCSNIGGGRLNCGMDVAGGTPDGPKILTADIEQGSGPNQIEKLESGYKKEDIKVHDNTGGIIDLSSKVHLSGKLSIAPDGGVCLMTVDKIEK